jgi:uncharacterized protein DUF2617
MTTHYHLRPPVEEMNFQLYGRPLHPELFDVLAFRRIRQAGWSLDLLITTTGHVVSWQHQRIRLTELIAGREELPEWGHLLKHRLRGERCDMLGASPGVNYQVSFQVESLPADKFLRVHHEIRADAGRSGLMHAYATSHRWALTPVSAVHVEFWTGCLSLTAFHTFPDEYAVVKSQSLIEF